MIPPDPNELKDATERLTKEIIAGLKETDFVETLNIGFEWDVYRYMIPGLPTRGYMALRIDPSDGKVAVGGFSKTMDQLVEKLRAKLKN